MREVIQVVVFGVLILVCALWLTGCMRLHVEAREGSTVNITESGNKTVTTTTDANIPAGALGL